MDTRWQNPFTAIVAGPTCSGKSHFVQRFLRHLDAMCDRCYERILFYYTEWQTAYAGVGGNESRLSRSDETYSRIEFREGLPRYEDYSSDNERAKLLVLDDLMRESSQDDTILDLFTRGSHHKNLSVIFVTQNVFRQGRAQQRKRYYPSSSSSSSSSSSTSSNNWLLRKKRILLQNGGSFLPLLLAPIVSALVSRLFVPVHEHA